MTIELRPVALPELDLPVERPAIPAETYAARVAAAHAAAGCDWLAVYADREHHANIAFLSGFDPRFEETLLLAGPRGERLLFVGNECLSYAVVAALPDVETRLVQSFSLMAQDRTAAPNFGAVLREAGIRRGDTVGLVGWKYLEPEEQVDGHAGFWLPEFVVAAFRSIVGDPGSVRDATAVLMHPVSGLASVIDADQIAAFEWASARASAAVARIVTGAREGDNEFVLAARMAYAGEPLTCHMMLASAGPDAALNGLRSPSARRPARGDGIVTAVGYWGGLSARGGLFADRDDAFLELAKGYFAGLTAWYEVADIGAAGGDIHEHVVTTLARAGLRPALNPGHLTGYTEWTHSPIRPKSTDRIASGMPVQVDIIPVPLRDGWALNCEDGVAFADATLREALAARHPEVSARIGARRRFVADAIGVELSENILPLSATPLWLPPFWLAPGMALARR